MSRLVLFAAVMAVATPVLAQQEAPPPPTHVATMTAEEMRQLDACNAMAPAVRAKDAACAALWAKHPDMMKARAKPAR